MTPIELLLARAEISDLIVTYCITFDDQNWEEFAKLWTDDASFAVEDYTFEGKQTLLNFLTTCLPKGYVSKHMISRPLIELASDGLSARARTDVVWIAANFENAIVGRYSDEIVKQNGKWKFRIRRETPVPYRAGPTPMSEAAQTVSGESMHQALLDNQ
ncbi:MAG: nuclear transport factor 2 family protein [Gammaproteobacteria bacterium]